MPTEQPRTITEWVNSPKPRNTSLNGVIADIRDNLMPLFEYGFPHLTDDPSAIEFDPEDRIVYFKAVDKLNRPDFNKGQCSELSTKAYDSIRRKYPETKSRLAIVDGKCAPFFFQEGDIHQFLVLYEHPIIYQGRPIIDYNCVIEDLLKGRASEVGAIRGNNHIIDPSFNTVTTVNDPSYAIDNMSISMSLIPRKRRLVALREGNNIMPIATIKGESIFHIGFSHGQIYIVKKDRECQRTYFLHGSIDSEVTPEERSILERMNDMRETIIQAMSRN